jgi:hypothetical protein
MWVSPRWLTDVIKKGQSKFKDMRTMHTVAKGYHDIDERENTGKTLARGSVAIKVPQNKKEEDG